MIKIVTGCPPVARWLGDPAVADIITISAKKKEHSKWSGSGRVEPVSWLRGQQQTAAVARKGGWCRSAVVRELNLD